MLKKGVYTIAIVDSGIGGISILKQIIKKHVTGNFIYFADNQYMPYGNKTKEFIKQRIEDIIYYLKNEFKVNKIIIACNTASSSISGLNLGDVEVLTFDKSKTYLTTLLTSFNLKGYNTISDGELACKIEKYIFKPHKLDYIIKCCVNKYNLNDLNSFVLGCTHFELVENIFKKYCPNTKIYLNSTGVIDKIEYKQADELNITIVLSQKNRAYAKKIIKLINSN